MPRRVLFVDTHVGFGGAARALPGQLRRLDAERFELIVCCRAEGRPARVLSGLPEVDVVPCRFGAPLQPGTSGPLARCVDLLGLPVVLLAVLRVTALAVRRRVDVIHVSDESRGLFVAALAARFSRRPLILHLHGACRPDRGRRMALSRASRILAVSRSVKADHVRCFGPVLESIEVLPLGVDPPGPREGPDLREELGLPDDALVIACVADLAPSCGQVDLLRAFADVLGVHHDAYLLLVGEDAHEDGTVDYDAYLSNLSAQLGVDDQVRFLPFHADGGAVFRTADIVVCAEWERSSMQSLLEPLACGRPIVATDVGGATELIREGETGCLVPPKLPEALAETLLRLADDDELRARLGLAAARAVDDLAAQSNVVTAALEQVGVAE